MAKYEKKSMSELVANYHQGIRPRANQFTLLGLLDFAKECGEEEFAWFVSEYQARVRTTTEAGITKTEIPKEAEKALCVLCRDRWFPAFEVQASAKERKLSRAELLEREMKAKIALLSA